MRIRQDFFVTILLLLKTCLTAEARGVDRSLEKTFSSQHEIRTLERRGESVRQLQSRQANLPCTLNERGFYGEPIGSVYEVEYIYQIHVEAGTRISVIRVLVLPELDKRIAESILPSFFDCGTRRQLQTQTIEGVSWRPLDVVVESGLSCDEPMDGADCYIVKGFFSVFAEGYESMREVENAVLPVVRESMQSDELLSASDLLIGVDYIGTDLVDRVPTSAPNGAPSPTVPNPPVPTSAPNSDPSPTLAPNLSPSSTSAPTRSLWPTWSETEFPTSSNRGPTLSPTTFAPTSPTPTAPLAPSPSGPVAPPSSQNSTDIVTDESKEGLDKMVWWMWLLVGIGAAVSLLFCIGVLFGRSSRGPSKRAVRSDDGTDPTHIGTLSKFEQSRQEYIPPGEQMDTFHISPSKRGNIEELDESQEESTDDQDEGADEEGGFGFSYGDEDARENDAVVEYEDEEDEDVDFRGSRRTSANNLENKDQFGDQDQFDDQEQFDDENIFEDEGTYEPDGDVYDDGKTYEDEGDDGDYEEYEEDGEVYDDEDVYEDEEYDEEADDEEYEEEGDEDYVEGEEEVYQEEEGELSYDEESYYTEEVEEEGPRWDSSFQVDRTNSL